MNKEEITKEDILNATGSIFNTMFDYVDNSNKEIEQLQQENKQLKEKINNIGYCELKRKCDEGLCDCTNEEYNSMCEHNMILSLRIDKLKEYIEENVVCMKEGNLLVQLNVNELFKILKEVDDV